MLPTEGFQPTLSKLTAVLDRLRVRYHLTGGIATVASGGAMIEKRKDTAEAYGRGKSEGLVGAGGTRSP
jgi:hypothetical protein